MAGDGLLLLPVSSYHLPPVCVCVLVFLSYRDTCHMGLGPTLIISFNLITSFHTLSPNTFEFCDTENESFNIGIGEVGTQFSQ